MRTGRLSDKFTPDWTENNIEAMYNQHITELWVTNDKKFNSVCTFKSHGVTKEEKSTVISQLVKH